MIFEFRTLAIRKRRTGLLNPISSIAAKIGGDSLSTSERNPATRACHYGANLSHLPLARKHILKLKDRASTGIQTLCSKKLPIVFCKGSAFAKECLKLVQSYYLPANSRIEGDFKDAIISEAHIQYRCLTFKQLEQRMFTIDVCRLSPPICLGDRHSRVLTD
jgi:hypothetical protein